jgi:hypothetical protein
MVAWTLGALVAASPADAQPKREMAHLGYLSDRPGQMPVDESFLQGLRELVV